MVQFHFTHWPDYGVPNTTTAARTLRNLVNDEHLKRNVNGPIVVHCRLDINGTLKVHRLKEKKNCL